MSRTATIHASAPKTTSITLAGFGLGVRMWQGSDRQAEINGASLRQYEPSMGPPGVRVKG